MKYLICKKGRGEGCDYTIGCNMRFDWIECDSIQEAELKAVWPDGNDELSSVDIDKELSIQEIYIIPVENVTKVDVDSWVNEIEDHKRKQKKDRIDAAERATIESLLKKHPEYLKGNKPCAVDS